MFEFIQLIQFIGYGVARRIYEPQSHLFLDDSKRNGINEKIKYTYLFIIIYYERRSDVF